MIYFTRKFTIAKHITPIDNRLIALLISMLSKIPKTNTLTPIPKATAIKINLRSLLFIITTPSQLSYSMKQVYFKQFMEVMLIIKER